MLHWLAENWVTLVLAAVLAGIVAGVVIKLVRDKKKGKTSCGCGCANCAMAGSCHAKKQ